MPDTSNQNYPRAAPYRAPTDPAPRGGRPGLNLLAALTLVVVTAAGTVVALRWARARPTAEREANDDRQASPVTPADRPGRATPLDKPSRERYLSALGMLSSAQVYQTYLNIGLLADGVESEAYTKAEAEQMLATVVSLIEQADRQLDLIKQTGLDADDQANVERVQDLTALLRRQASALRAYWATGDRDQITRYHETRESTWKSLSEALNLE